jgi:hypothetical protein
MNKKVLNLAAMATVTTTLAGVAYSQCLNSVGYSCCGQNYTAYAPSGQCCTSFTAVCAGWMGCAPFGYFNGCS